MHPPYNYHLFLSMVNALSGTNLASIEACENKLSEFFANRNKNFYEWGILKLDFRWHQDIERNDAYLT